MQDRAAAGSRKPALFTIHVIHDSPGGRQQSYFSGKREEIVFKILVDLDRIGVHLVKLLAVSLASYAERPHDAAAAIAIFGEEGLFAVEILVLDVAALKKLAHGKLARLAE